MPVKPTRSGKTRKTHEEAQEEETVWLKDFHFNTKKVPCPTILLVGKRFSGKSYTAVSVCDKLDMPRWAAWCGTKETEDFWAERFESNATVKSPNDSGKDYLIQVIKYQQRKSQQYKRLNIEWPKKLSVGLIFDDITANKKFRAGPELEDLFSNGRHYHCAIVVSAQYLKQLPPAVRLNTDYMFMMHNSKRTIKVLYEDYVEEPDEFAMFLQLIRSVTGQKDENGKDLYNALVYDNVNKTQQLDEVFKIYRNEGEEYLNKVKLGNPEWREYNKTHFKDEEAAQQVREERKRDRERRIKLHRQKQLERKNGMFSGVVYEQEQQPQLDIYDDDSDSEKEDETETHDTAMLQPRKGTTIRVQFSKQKTAQESTVINSQPSYVEPSYVEPSYSQHGYSQHGYSQPTYSQTSRPDLFSQQQQIHQPYQHQHSYTEPNTYQQQQEFIRANSTYVPNRMFL